MQNNMLIQEEYKKFLEYNAHMHKFQETWKPIVNDYIADGYYISTYGRVYCNFNKSFIYPDLIDNLVKVYLFNKQQILEYYTLDRLVAEAFIPIPENFLILGYNTEMLTIDHINGINVCNASFNLQWARAKHTKLPDQVIHTICKDLELGNLSSYEIAKRYNVTYVTVNNIKRHRAHIDISKNYKF